MIVDEQTVISCHRCRGWTRLRLGKQLPDGRHETSCGCGTEGVIAGLVYEIVFDSKLRKPVRYTRPRS